MPKQAKRNLAKSKRSGGVGPVVLGAAGMRQDRPIVAVAISSDGSRIASGDALGKVQVFDRATEACLFTATWKAGNPKRHHEIQRLLFSPDGAVILAITGSSGNGQLCAGSVATGETLWETATVYEFPAFSPDGARLAVVSFGALDLLNPRDGTALRVGELPKSNVRQFAWSEEGDWLVTVLADPTNGKATRVQVLDGRTFVVRGEHDLARDLSGVEIAFGNDGRLVAIVNDEQEPRQPHILRFFPPTLTHDDRPITGHLPRGALCNSLLAGRGEALLHTYGTAPVIVDLASAAVTRLLRRDTDKAATTPDGALVVTTHGVALRVWDSAWKELSTPPGLSTEVHAIAFSPDGERVITVDRTGVRTWALDGTAVSAQERGVTYALTGDAGAALVVSEGATFPMNLADGTRRWPGLSQDKGFKTLSFDGRLAATRAHPTGTVEIWSMERGERLHAIEAERGSTIHDQAFSPDGAWLAVGTWDKGLHLFDTATGAPLFRRKVPDDGWGQRALAFSRDGRLLASGDDQRTVRLWSLPQGTLVRTLEGHRRARIHATAFSPDGELLASADEVDVRLWSTRTGEALGVARMGASCLAFSPDGTRLAVGGMGTAAIVEVAALKGK